MDDPHGKKAAWRNLGWSFVYSALILAAGFVLLWGSYYLDSTVLTFLGLAALVGGFLQPVGYGLFEVFAAHVWRPLWQNWWFQWFATAILLGIIGLTGWVVFFTDRLE